jgi:hypothetical protein
MRKLLPFVLPLLLLMACAQRRPQATAPSPWAEVERLMENGQYASALEALAPLRAEAAATGDWRGLFRAHMLWATNRQLTGAEPEEVLLALEEELAALDTTAEHPLRQLLHSVLAHGYWTYYSDNRWRILDRGHSTAATADPTTWGQRRFMEHITAHALGSMEPFQALPEIPAARLGELISWPPGTVPAPVDAAYRRSGSPDEPLLIDLLARRALEVLRSSETRVTEPAWRFRLEDPAAFALFELFAQHPLHHRDSLSWEFQALRIWQRWEQAHLADDHPELLAEITLDRLDFVHRNSFHPAKDSLLHSALHALRHRVEQQPVWSDVTVALARHHAELGERYQRLDTVAKWQKRTAAELCVAAMERYSASMGARNAAVLHERLTRPALDLHAPQAVVPGLPFKVALGHAAVSRVWFRLVRTGPVLDPETMLGRQDPLERLLAARPEQQWHVDLPDDGDLHRHVVELAVPAVQQGSYVLLASTEERMRTDRGLIAHVPFWCTRIAFTERRLGADSLELLLFDRSTGAALPGATAELFMSERNYGGPLQKVAQAAADPQGRVLLQIAAQQGRGRWRITTAAGDSYISGGNWYHGDHFSGEGDSVRTFLFTDRAIYRPGQTVHLKGITTVRRGGTTVVKPGHRVLLRLFDANGRQTDSLDLRTDAFGACAGSFKAPVGLTGHMRIDEQHGSAGFLVEEYVRPKFEVVFDTTGTPATWGGEVLRTGTARSYTGVPLVDARVRWKVDRIMRMPWWSRSPWIDIPGRHQPVEMASGEAVTDSVGRFTIRFTATADQAVRWADPVFHFNLEAAVTDPGGETHMANTTVSVGRQSMYLETSLGDAVDRGSVRTVEVWANNLDGRRLQLPVDVQVHRLKAPRMPYRERMWERPDRFVLDARQHSELFPLDPWDNEHDPLEWPRDSTLLSWRTVESATGAFRLPEITSWTVGTYLLEMRAVDIQGREVRMEKVFTLFDPTGRELAFTQHAFHVVQIGAAPSGTEPGGAAKLLVSSALPQARIALSVERGGRAAPVQWIELSQGQRILEFPVGEADRGGFAVHVVSVANERSQTTTVPVAVPWSNKELQLEWTHFRDHALPGAREEIRLRLRGPQGARVEAQLLATLYDASLDHFTPHQWHMFQWPIYQVNRAWNAMEPLGAVAAYGHGPQPLLRDTLRVHPQLRTFGWPLGMGRSFTEHGDHFIHGMAAPALRGNAKPEGSMEEMALGKDEGEGDGEQGSMAPVPQPVRSDFRETAFFKPDLITDRDGALVLRFTLPDALTRWRLMGLAHTRDLAMVQFEREIVTRKPLMVVPNLPRFLREGDRITLTARIDALEERSVPGTAQLELFDPQTGASFDRGYGLVESRQRFMAAPGRSAQVRWTVKVPSGATAVGIRISARGAAVGDAEEHVLPVLPDRLLVEESLPLPMSRGGSRQFTLEKLRADTSSTLRHHALSLEFTPNPGWYAVQALPFLADLPDQGSEQLFSRFLSHALAAHLVQQRPQVRKVVEAWQQQARNGSDTTLLERNSRLRNILLEETPWVLQASNERERRQRLALLLDLERMGREQALTLEKLHALQRPDGAWPWFGGMLPDRLVTQHIVAGMGQLQQLGALPDAHLPPLQDMLDRALRWMDAEADRSHRERLKHMDKAARDAWMPDHAEVQYLFARSYFPGRPYSAGAAHAARAIQDRLAAEWLRYGLQDQAMIALLLHRLNKGDDVPQQVLRSLRERATHSDELGMYWKHFVPGTSWNSFPTETYALVLQAFHEVAGDAVAVEEIKLHLLKLKQTTHWPTTKATAAACHALLLTGNDLLAPGDPPRITVGGRKVDANAQEAGTGYFSTRWKEQEISPAMGTVTIAMDSGRTAWGALHWQYFERIDRITPHQSPFTLERELLVRRRGEEGAVLHRLGQGEKLVPGDRITVRITLRTDRYLDHVHLKDLRAAGLEPVDQLSGPRWKAGLGYYQSVRDVGMHFFLDRLPPGVHLFECDLVVSHAGEFSHGITSATCLYAPEFSAHSGGDRILIPGE